MIAEPSNSLDVVDVAPSMLRPHPANPRTISDERFEALKRALAAAPAMMQARPLIALRDGTVVCGNMRLRAAQALGWSLVPVIYVDLDEHEAIEWMLRDNHSYGEWEEQGLSALLHELDQASGDLELTGFADEELLRLLDSTSRADPDQVPPLPEGEPDSKPGKTYELGPHRLMCGDATSAEQIGELMGAESAACVFTDPPYGVSYEGGMRRRERLAGDSPGTTIYHQALPLMVRHAAPQAAFYIWFADLANTAAAVADAGLTVRCQIVWVKNHAQFMSSSHYHGKHESCIYAARFGEAPKWYGPKNEITVWEHARAARNDLHPTQKPVALAKRALMNSTRRGELLLDPFAGSGSTLLAAEQMSRRCYAMEIDPGYCDVIRRRYAVYANRPDLAP